jgi:hypothetical protein
MDRTSSDACSCAAIPLIPVPPDLQPSLQGNVRERRFLRGTATYTPGMVRVAAGTVVIYSDIACPWTHVAMHRIHAARRRLGLEGRVALVHRAFPLELINRRPTPRRVLDAEIPVAGALAPDAGWQLWQAPDWEWPVTTLLALEAVRAAEVQSLRAAEELDLGLRRALFAQSRCISLLPVILDVAEGSPHLFLADGSSHFNPGVRVRWEGEHGRGFPVVEADDPSAVDAVLERAADPAGASAAG